MMLSLIVVLLVATMAKSQVCQDRRKDCAFLKYLCIKPVYKQFMTRNCINTCRFCSTGGVCQDARNDCNHLKHLCGVEWYKQWMTLNCPRTCRFCKVGGGITSPRPPPTPRTLPNSGPPVTHTPIGACGNPQIANARVIAGTTATRGSWPWQVLMSYNGRAGCGGSLISPSWVVTAAHCVSGKEHNAHAFTIRVGEHNRNSQEGSEKEYKVSQVITHPRYSARMLNNDIALFKLSSPVQMSKYVHPVCLPTSDVSIGTECYITGWGKTKHPGSMTFILQQTILPVVSKNVCERLNKNTIPIPITDAMICAGSGGSSQKSGCHGDSGGPFVCRVNGKWELHGAVSHGSPRCNSRETYTVFSKITYFKKWIDQNMAIYGI